MTKDEILAASKVSKDFWFSNYYYIPVVGKGAQLFNARPYQKHIAKRIDVAKLIIGLKARQIGWTTIGVASALHDALFSDEHPWLFISKNEDAAMKMLDKAKYAYTRLPGWMQNSLPRLENYTQTTMTFENGSRIESVPATASTGRGDSVYGALMDECAFMEYAEEIWGAVEPLVYGPAMLFSTANGMGNFFHEIWLDAQREDSVWEAIFYPWSVVPERTDAWYDHARRSFRGREWLFYQEYASTPEEAFARSGRVAFSSTIIDECYEEIEPHAKFAWEIGAFDRGEEIKEISLNEEADIEVYMWRPPEVVRDEWTGRPLWKPNYIVAADIAEGLDHGDFTYVTVFDANTGEQMLSSKSAIPVSYLDELVEWAGLLYLKGLAILERNNAGVLPLDRLYRDRVYPRLYRMDTIAEFRTGDRTPRYGWQTNKATKPKMVNDFYHALSEGKVLLHDPEFLIEAQTFVADGRGSYAATNGRHDDVIMGTLIAYQGVLDSPKYPVLWTDDRVLPPTHEEIDALIFDDVEPQAIDALEMPLGQREPVKYNKTFVFTESNVRRRDIE
jgi:hypothetical protein